MMAVKNAKGIHTPFDNAFKSIMRKCPRLALMLINELFYRKELIDEEYTGKEKVVLLDKELPGMDSGSLEMDLRLSVYGKSIRHFHLECESTNDGTMILRMVQYDLRSAMEEADYQRAELNMRIDDSGILFLRSSSNTPNVMTVNLTVPQNQVVRYVIPVLKMKDYTLDAILEKKLYILMPFLYFNYEQKLRKAGEDQQIFEEINLLYEIMLKCLREHAEAGMITAYEASTLFDALKTVLEALGKTNRASEEVETIMGGIVLEFSADKYYDAGRIEGEEKGREEGRAEGREEGRAEGEEKLGRLISAMKEAGKEKEAFRAATDRVFREKMYMEYQIED